MSEVSLRPDNGHGSAGRLSRGAGAPRGWRAPRGRLAWSAAFFAVGLVVGPLMSGTVNHGHFVTGSWVCGGCLAVVLGLFTGAWVGIDYQISSQGGDGDRMTCTALPNGRWLVTGEPDSTSTTQVERYGAYYVALTVDSQSLAPISAARLPKLFASLHRADDADLAAAILAESNASFWG